VFTNIKEDEFLSTNRKSLVVVDGDGNIKRKTKGKRNLKKNKDFPNL
jgi:hypothetical protein